MAQKPIIILDYGHGNNCPGKCAPDKSWFEWKFNREIGGEIAKRLAALGYTVRETWTQDHEPLSTPGRVCTKAQLDTALNYRWKEVNKICAANGGAKNCICISIHANAAGSGGNWFTARGFSVFVGTNASAASKKLAKAVYDEADKAGLRGNRSVPAERYWVKALAMTNRTNCPAILTESMFYDNKEDLAFLKSEAGKAKLIDVHVKGITNYIKTL